MKQFIKLVVLFMLVLAPMLVVSKSKDSDNPKNDKATIHVYRPNKIVGFGWVFNLKANGQKIARIKNGRLILLSLEPGQTEFKMAGKTIKINLEPGKNYYLRASLARNLLLGSPELIEVTKSYAMGEMNKIK